MTGAQFAQMPAFAAWRHRGVRDGFEVLFVRTDPDGHRLEGHSTAVEDGRAWAVDYVIVLQADWVTRRVRVRAQSDSGSGEVRLERSGPGTWLVDGAPFQQLDLDLADPAPDLEHAGALHAVLLHQLDDPSSGLAQSMTAIAVRGASGEPLVEHAVVAPRVAATGHRHSLALPLRRHEAAAGR